MTHPSETPEGRAALSRAHSPQVVCILRLDSGRFAIYNYAKQFQGIVTDLSIWPPPCWSPPAERPAIDLHDLGIL
jgi:hypothetical protein